MILIFVYYNKFILLLYILFLFLKFLLEKKMRENFTTQTNSESTNNNSEYEWDLIKNILYLLIFSIGTIGNLIVIFTIFMNKKLRSTTHIYLLNLSIADFVYLLSIPLTVVTSIKQQWIFGTYFCKMFWSFNGINQFASVALVSALSIDR